MGSYRYEIHTHTAEVSSCGYVNAKEVVNMHKDAGYQGVVITDHFNEEYFSRLEGKSWDEKIMCFLEGYRQASAEGRRIGIDVLWGIELRFTENDNDFLVYGLDEAFLKKNENLHLSNIREFMELINERQDTLVYQAHPFRDGCQLVNPLIVHGLEIFNGNPRHDSRNHLAAQIASDNNLLVISGSDFHRPGDLATGGILLRERASDMKVFTEQLKSIQCDSLIKKDIVCA